MIQKAKEYISQYKILFSLSWICLYLIFPTWISLHSTLKVWGLSHLGDQFARSLGILGLIIYFAISAYLISRYFSCLILDKPVVIKVNNWSNIVKQHFWLVIVCCLAVVLHFHSLSFVEVGYLEQTLWLYDFSNKYWHRLFDFPIQYFFWSLIALLILIIKMKITVNPVSNYIKAKYSSYKSNNLTKLLFLFIMFVFFSVYSYAYPYSLQESLILLRFPPVAKLLYLITYYAFGFSQIVPRIVQLAFYVLSAVYIYRTINLFREKENALLGATIYLFSPVIFYYASLTFFASGTVFFMILISFHFLRFIKDGNDRDLVLASYFIGIGFLYKRVVLLMFIICFAYLIISKIKTRNRYSFIHFMILALSLISVLPFLIIGRMTGFNFYAPVLSNLMSFDYIFLIVQSQISVILSFIFLLSIVYVLFKRDDLSLYYVLYFIAYYLFFTLQLSFASQRYSMAVYPAVAVLLAQFIFSISRRPGYRLIYKLSFLILTVYLIFLCLVPRDSSNLVTFKYKDFENQQFPIEKATDWIKDNTGKNDKIFVLPMPAYRFYVKRFYKDTKTLNPNRFVFLVAEEIKNLYLTHRNPEQYFIDRNGSYIMLPFSPKGAYPIDKVSREMITYLKENKNNQFTEVSKFNREDNYILIYKLKKKSQIE